MASCFFCLFFELAAQRVCSLERTFMVSFLSHEKPKRLGSIEHIGTQTFDKRLDHYISNRPKRLNF